MPRTLFLHTGMHKTGTSSIQQTLHAAADTLAAHGLLYPTIAANHSAILQSAFSDPAEAVAFRGHIMRNRAEPEAIARFNARHLAALEASFAAHPDHDAILSGEAMGRLSPTGVDRLLAFAGAHFAAIQVVVFVRPPVAALASKLQQYIKGGRTAAWLEHAEIAANYRWSIEKFADRIPPEALHLRVFAPATLVRGCSVATLLDAIGADPALYDRLDVIRANESISALAAELLLAANAALPPVRDGAANPARARTLRGTLGAVAGARYTAPAALVERTRAASAEDVAWLRDRFGIDIAAFDRAPADASPPPPATPEREAELAAIVTAVNTALLRQDATDAETAARPAPRDAAARRRRRKAQAQA